MTKANRWIAAGLLTTALAMTAQPAVFAFFGLEQFYARYQQAYRAWQRHGMLP